MLKKERSFVGEENMSEKKYLIAGFPNEKSVEIIPSTWMINKNTSYWPIDAEKNHLKQMIKRCDPPISTWPQIHVKIYGGSSK